ncbi:MAG TPA: hypothetical protein VM870_01325, partial [Pyrinomonadaceae bacterium]|nr:hypothetical protein [Pyrinomonadaceae bacterium]
SGTVALQNESAGQKQQSKLAQLSIYCQIEGNEPGMWFYPRYGKVTANNSFRVGGLPPGKMRLYVTARNGRANLTAVRVEHDGVEQPDGFTLAAGEDLSGVRVIVAEGTGVVAGTVKVEGGTLPDNAQMYVNLQRAAHNGQTALTNSFGSDVDSRGRFLIENVLSGDYEIILNAMQPPAPGQPPRQIPPVKKSVSVSDGARVEVTLTLDLGAAPPLPQQLPAEGNTP